MFYFYALNPIFMTDEMFIMNYSKLCMSHESRILDKIHTQRVYNLQAYFFMC